MCLGFDVAWATRKLHGIVYQQLRSKSMQLVAYAAAEQLMSEMYGLQVTSAVAAVWWCTRVHVQLLMPWLLSFSGLL